LILAAVSPALADDAPATLSTGGSPWSIGTQATYIDQFHFSFPSAYEGPNSLGSGYDVEHTFSFSLFIGRRIWAGGELFYDPEIFQGFGLSHTFGIAGFPNGEAVKSGFPHLHYNTSRLMIRQMFGFGGGKEAIEADPRQLAGEEDVNRLVISVGKFSANDFFDDNAYSHDSRSQFMNWALWESAAWDYPADVVGFTAGAVAEWNSQNAAWHFGVFMEPTEINGPRLDYHIGKAIGQILQYDRRYEWNGRHGTIRSFVYWNQAHMGLYSAAAGQPYPENLDPTRAYRSKEGFGSSWDQELTEDIGVFVRVSWNDGRTDDFAFTEIDRSLAGGLSLNGKIWGRAPDTVGLALAVNGLSSDHRHYLENGGTGLILGDGMLSYAPEEIMEAYYNFKPWHWLQIGPDFQYVRNPGYNSARGPVPIYAFRAHVEF
jgi:high affinity Mn2+ porin